MPVKHHTYNSEVLEKNQYYALYTSIIAAETNSKLTLPINTLSNCALRSYTVLGEQPQHQPIHRLLCSFNGHFLTEIADRVPSSELKLTESLYIRYKCDIHVLIC